MSEFKALVVEEQGGDFVATVKQRTIEDLPAGEVLIDVHYSSVNYKDALSASGNRGVTKRYPHTPGIDAAGVVLESNSGAFGVGDEVIVTGYDLGMNTSGGFAERIRVPSNWVVPLPENLSLRESMILGTAGLTAAMCVDSLVQVGITPGLGEILVTGATGGVGSIAVAILSKLRFDVAAGTGKTDSKAFLERLGAKTIVSREELLANAERPMLKERWGGVVDTVGGNILMNAIKATRYGGSIACCGMVASPTFEANVFPFILRGVNLLGVDSVELPLDIKIHMWNSLANEWKLDQIDLLLNREVTLEELPEVFSTLLKGGAHGRFLVSLK